MSLLVELKSVIGNPLDLKNLVSVKRLIDKTLLNKLCCATVGKPNITNVLLWKEKHLFNLSVGSHVAIEHFIARGYIL